jgi:DHA2 family multidrug resistance protein
MSVADPARARFGADESRSAAGDRNPWMIAVVISIATFMEVLDSSIANVALSHIAGSLAANADESTWVLTSYLVASAVILPASAWLSGAIGRKRFYLLCVALFTVSSFLCGIAPNLESLIAFRVLQGLGGGGMAPTEQSMLADTFPPEKRAQAFALYGVAVIVAPTIGPALYHGHLVVELDLLYQRADRRDLPCPRVLACQRGRSPQAGEKRAAQARAQV